MMQKANFYVESVILALCVSAALSCQVIQTGVQPHEKQIILDAHNRLRASVAMGRVAGQPGAENMREIVWDEELAARAQSWANQCLFKHDPQRSTNRFTMGQNMAIIWSTAPLAENDGDFPSRIQNWFNEVQKYAFGASWSPKTGHYSQLVWGETSMVGCGYSYYKTASKYNKLYVCNYGPGGNVIGSSPYAVGYPACESHGMSTSSRYQGLCSSSGGYGGSSVNSISSFGYKPTTFGRKSSFSSSFQQPQQPRFNNNYSFKNYFNSAPQNQFGFSTPAPFYASPSPAYASPTPAFPSPSSVFASPSSLFASPTPAFASPSPSPFGGFGGWGGRSFNGFKK